MVEMLMTDSLPGGGNRVDYLAGSGITCEVMSARGARGRGYSTTIGVADCAGAVRPRL